MSVDLDDLDDEQTASPVPSFQNLPDQEVSTCCDDLFNENSVYRVFGSIGVHLIFLLLTAVVLVFLSLHANRVL